MLKLLTAIHSAIFTKYGIDLNLTQCDLPDFQTIQKDFRNAIEMSIESHFTPTMAGLNQIAQTIQIIDKNLVCPENLLTDLPKSIKD
jgi:hypothetical protein